VALVLAPENDEPGRNIVTEYSHKYSPGEFHALAARAGLAPCRAWIDDDRLFSL
jgi:uncharacterized SAM-dependent methyltransferase